MTAARATALRRGLPYGVVMATGGASQLAGPEGLPIAARLLLLLALVQAIWIATTGAWRYRHQFGLGWHAWIAIGPLAEHTGIHTVPLGLAMIAGHLLTLSVPALPGWPPWPLAVFCLALVWLLALACMTRFAWSLLRYGLQLPAMDGRWFLVPAALLGAVVVTADATQVTDMAPGMATGLVMLAVASAVLATLGYWLVGVMACVRVLRHGLGAPRVPWWIAMGCAGLAVAGLGQVLALPGVAIPVQRGGMVLLVVTETAAILLCVPVIAASLYFLRRAWPIDSALPWPPTFSTAVFALGSLQAGRMLDMPSLQLLGHAAGFATLGLWLLTSAWNAMHALRHESS